MINFKVTNINKTLSSSVTPAVFAGPSLANINNTVGSEITVVSLQSIDDAITGSITLTIQGDVDTFQLGKVYQLNATT